MRTRTLFDPLTRRPWSTRCEGSSVWVGAGPGGKEKEKPTGSAAEALALAEKDEWARLKKGALLVNPEAAPGEPAMLRVLSGRHTGALVASELDGTLLTSAMETVDSLCVVGADGDRVDLCAFPEGTLVWSATASPASAELLVLADRSVLSRATSGGGISPLSVEPSKWPNLLSVAGGRAAFCEGTSLVVVALATRARLLHVPIAPELVGGHTWQLSAALSPDGTRLALCTEQGRLRVLEVPSGRALACFEAGFRMIPQLAFSSKGDLLFAQARYGEDALLCLALRTANGELELTEHPGWPSAFAQSRSVAIDPRRHRVAVSHGAQVTLVDCETMTSLLHFRADHVVKACALAFVGERLGVRTDRGCAGLYALDT